MKKRRRAVLLEDKRLADELVLKINLALMTGDPDISYGLVQRYLKTYVENDCIYIFDMALQELLEDISSVGTPYDAAYIRSLVSLMKDMENIAVFEHKHPEMTGMVDMDSLLRFVACADEDDIGLYADFVAALDNADEILTLIENVADTLYSEEELDCMSDITDEEKQNTSTCRKRLKELSGMIRQKQVIRAIQDAVDNRILNTSEPSQQ